MATPSAQDKVTEYQDLINGLQKNAPNLVLVLASQTLTSPQVVSILQSLLSASALVVSSKKSWHDAVVANTTIEAQYAALVAALRLQVSAMYANAETTLAQFGMTPKKPRKPLTTQQLATRAAKALATREARGTTGKKQKATITGGVTSVTITPVKADASSSPTPTTPTPAASSADGTAPSPVPATSAPTPAASAASGSAAPATPATPHS